MMRTCVFALVAALATAASAAEPFGWRGDGSGSFDQGKPPTAWSKDRNVAWRAKIPHGFNSPVYAQGRIFVTAEPALVLCFDANSGKEQWRASADYETALGAEQAAEVKRKHAQLEQEKQTLRRPFEEQRKKDPQAKEPDTLQEQTAEIDRRRDELEKQFPLGNRGGTGNVASTPVTDGERVYATFATGIVAAYTVEGEKLWIKHVEAPPLNFGHSASPVIAGGKLIVHFQHLIALDPASGAERWRTSVPAKHGSPVVANIGSEPVVVTASGAIVRASDGEKLAEKLFDLSDNSPLVHENVVYAHESGNVKALKLPAAITEPLKVETLWETEVKAEQRMTSAAYHEGVLYAGNRRGILDAIDADSGELLYRQRVQVGELFPSIIASDGNVLVSGTEGKTVVLQPGSDYQELAKCELERFSSSPILIGNRLYIRTDEALYCIADTSSTTIAGDDDE